MIIITLSWSLEMIWILKIVYHLSLLLSFIIIIIIIVIVIIMIIIALSWSLKEILIMIDYWLLVIMIIMIIIIIIMIIITLSWSLKVILIIINCLSFIIMIIIIVIKIIITIITLILINLMIIIIVIIIMMMMIQWSSYRETGVLESNELLMISNDIQLRHYEVTIGNESLAVLVLFWNWCSRIWISHNIKWYKIDITVAWEPDMIFVKSFTQARFQQIWNLPQ